MLDEINKLIDRRIALVIDKATVLSVSGTTCKVQSLTNDKIYFKCSLNAVIDNDNQELKITPAINSIVIIGVLDGQATVIQVSKISGFKVKIENTEFELSKDGVKVQRSGNNLKTLMDTQHTEFMNLCDAVNAIVVNPSAGTGPNVPIVTAIKNNIQLNKNSLDQVLI